MSENLQTCFVRLLLTSCRGEYSSKKPTKGTAKSLLRHFPEISPELENSSGK